MGLSRTIVAATAVAVAGMAGVVLASGGPPPADPVTDPPAFTVVATGTASRAVLRPARQTDVTVDRAVRAARLRAFPAAVASARAEASALGNVSGLRLERVVAARRDVGPLGYFGQDDGRFGPGVWCGRIYAGRRTVTRPDGSTRRVVRYRRGCQVPRDASVRVTLTFAARPTA